MFLFFQSGNNLIFLEMSSIESITLTEKEWGSVVTKSGTIHRIPPDQYETVGLFLQRVTELALNK